jgi:hypothetical protein
VDDTLAAPSQPGAEVANIESPVAEPAQEAPAAPSEGIPFMITRAMKAQLRKRGFADDQIAEMLPADAHRILTEPSAGEPIVERTREAPVDPGAVFRAKPDNAPLHPDRPTQAAAAANQPQQDSHEAIEKADIAKKVLSLRTYSDYQRNMKDCTNAFATQPEEEQWFGDQGFSIQSVRDRRKEFSGGLSSEEKAEFSKPGPRRRSRRSPD